MTTMRELIDEINAATARLRELTDEMNREREAREAGDITPGQRFRLQYFQEVQRAKRRFKEERAW